MFYFLRFSFLFYQLIKLSFLQSIRSIISVISSFLSITCIIFIYELNWWYQDCSGLLSLFPDRSRRLHPWSISEYSIRWSLHANNIHPSWSFRNGRKISVRLEGKGKGINQHLRYLINIPRKPQFRWNAGGVKEGGEFVFHPLAGCLFTPYFPREGKGLKIFIRFPREIRSVVGNRGYPVARGCEIN